jgi:hypothetical protein
VVSGPQVVGDGDVVGDGWHRGRRRGRVQLSELLSVLL